MDIIRREFIYLWFYFTVLLEQIFPYWLLGMLLGSAVSVFLKKGIHQLFDKLKNKKIGLLGILPACLLGIASPLCMYGTIPIAAAFSEKGMRDDWLAAFMVSSILLNPQLILYSTALGTAVFFVRMITCLFCGVFAGLFVFVFYRGKKFFSFGAFGVPGNRDTDPNLLIRYLKNLWRNVKATGVYFLAGMILAVLFQRYVPTDAFAGIFAKEKGFGVLLAASIGVPLYACGGGTIPLLQEWLWSGMSVGSAAAFMITGPATKITNLGALKSVLGIKRFMIYLLYIMVFAFVSGIFINRLL